MRETLGVVTRKGQITIPVAARRAMGLKEGDKVSIVFERDTLKVKRARSWVERTRGIVKHEGPPLTPEQEDEAFGQAIVDDYLETEKRMK